MILLQILYILLLPYSQLSICARRGQVIKHPAFFFLENVTFPILKVEKRKKNVQKSLLNKAVFFLWWSNYCSYTTEAISQEELIIMSLVTSTVPLVFVSKFNIIKSIIPLRKCHPPLLSFVPLKWDMVQSFFNNTKNTLLSIQQPLWQQMAPSVSHKVMM